jgi:CubicO group peptidase (beta-lactamase class C family)
MNSAYRRVNLLELFAHRSGMAYYPRNVTPQQINARSPTIVGQRYDYTKAALTDPPEAPPGTKTIYSGGPNIAATIAERRLGRSYEELMRAYIFEPLGLHCHFGGASRPDAVDGPWNHARESGRFVPVRPEGQPPPPNVPHASSTPVGGVACSASDLALFLGEHLPRNSRRRGLLSERALEVLHAHVEGGQFAPGFLYDPQSWLGAGVLWHYGSNGTYLAACHVVPDRNFAIVALTNGSGPPADKGIDEANKLLVRWANYTEE